MKENSKIINSMDMEFINGKMENSMKVNSKMVRLMGKENLYIWKV